MTTECRLCPGRICVVQGDGRIINDNGDKKPIDLSKIRFDPTPIQDCGLIDSMDTDDERLLLGC